MSIKPFQRICLLVLDSCGCGELPDAADYGDEGSDTLKHVDEVVGGLNIPNLKKLGLAHAGRLTLANPSDEVSGFWTRMREASIGKDTATGHLELMGLPVTEPFSYFPKGFEDDILEPFLELNHLQGYLGNKAASGTEIIKELGEEHLKTGYPIIYTSADSVFQIAWHEEKFGLERLYEICETTRKFLIDSPHMVGRVIARPFIGANAKDFNRTTNRKDYALDPHGKTALDFLMENKISTIGIGKIPSIYNYKGISKDVVAKTDEQGLQKTIQILEETNEKALIFSNLNDLDMLYGHRRNPEGYGQRLEMIDSHLPQILQRLGKDDLLMITADHGNDPTYPGSDHTREYVPLVVYSPRFSSDAGAKRGLVERQTFADVAETILENFQLPGMNQGKSFLKEIHSLN